MRKQTDYLFKLKEMFCEIEEAYDNEKDPLTRCELAKGYCMIGEVLSSAGLMT